LRQVKNRVLTLKQQKSMKKSTFTEAQILKVLKTQEDGKKVSEICREFGISEPTFYKWKSKYGGMTLSELQRVKELESENARLKRLVADLSLDNQVLKEINSKKW
jgi:putative transposase